jgi:hypothetical protein
MELSEIDAQYRQAVIGCAGITMAPALLAFVAWTVSRDSGIPDGAGSGVVSPVILWTFAALALATIGCVPLVRSIADKQTQVVVTGGRSTSSATVWALTEYALWEICSLLGFVAFIMGATWAYFGAALVVTYVGFAVSFPRRSVFERRVQQATAAQGLAVEQAADGS